MQVKKITKIFIINLIVLNIFGNKVNNISVLGVGRLGICTALILERNGFNILGLDINEDYVSSLSKKTFKSPEPMVSEYLTKSNNFNATTNLDKALEFSDIYFIIVPTPNGKSTAYDHSILNNLLTAINNRKISNKHLIICCTVFPGYIKNTASKLLKDCNNITISYNPEFIAQGNIIKGFECPDLVLIGEGSTEIGNILEKIYKKICPDRTKICRMSPESAEITKLAINCFVTTKIAFANFIGDLADITKNANKFDILNAIGSDSRIGNKYLKPGYGFGGPCFPRDNRALGDYAFQKNLDPLLQKTTDRLNKEHAEFMAKQLVNKNLEEYIFEDVNYKENCTVTILEESQKLAVAEIVANAGKTVVIKDKQNVLSEVKNIYGNLFKYREI